MKAEPSPHTLEAMEAIHRSAEELLALLHEERRAIAALDVDSLDRTAVRKMEAARNLADARADIHELGGTTDPAGIHHWLDREDEKFPELAELRSRVEAVLKRCDEANALNGRLIATGKLQAESALDVIAGALTRGEMTTYAPDGAQHRGPRSQALESA